MEAFLMFLKANHWKGTHLRQQIKKFALLERRRGESQSRTQQTIARAWTKEDGRFYVRDRRAARVFRLYGQDDQRTDAWHAKRSEMITASEVGNIVEGTPSSRHEVLLRKLVPQVQDEGRKGNFLTNPLLWGTKFEPIAKRIYERDTKCSIRDVSCVQHPTIPYLGASPDGVILCPDDRERHHCLVEFKCPISRKITGEIPKAYVHQMQLQMECTGVDECEQVEFSFKKVFYSEWLNFTGTKGIFAVYNDGRVEELDAPIPMDMEDGMLAYWILAEINRDLVVRDPEWLPKHRAVLADFWAEVQTHRAAGSVPDKPGVLKLAL